MGIKGKQEIVHYCCGSYQNGNIGGVARYDYQLSIAFPKRVFFEGLREKKSMLSYLGDCQNPVVITDNHLACDIPNQYETIIVHHGVARTHAEREPLWNSYWKNLCCSGQDRMLFHRSPVNTRIISSSQFCTEEFTRHYGERYTQFERIDLLYPSDLDESRSKTTCGNDCLGEKKRGKKRTVLGNWSDNNKGYGVVRELARMADFRFGRLKVALNHGSITDFNRRKQDVYLGCDIFLQISRSEGGPYAALDALACGVPIVSSNVGIFYKDVPDECFVKIDWRRVADVVYLQDRLEFAWEQREVLGRQGRQWYMKNCRFDNWIQAMRNHVLAS